MLASVLCGSQRIAICTVDLISIGDTIVITSPIDVDTKETSVTLNSQGL
ncbi:MAG: hypothetical protein IPG00_20685 [Saprospiraceae bacterium]|nr:hypothetical protein [Saprospiraceae bacterium]